MTIPTKKQLDAMSIAQLIEKMITDITNTSHYRSRLANMLVGYKSGHNMLVDYVRIYDRSRESEPVCGNAESFDTDDGESDFEILFEEFREAESLASIFQILKDDKSWDRTDPSNRMKKSVKEVNRFIDDVIDNEYAYKNMTKLEKGFARMCLDVYERHLGVKK